MDNIKYSEKEIAIFNGLIKLMREGVNPYLIKVSDIARAANIGKGTIYDYFTSKEEVISKAIIYSISQDIQTMTRKVNAKQNFKDRLYQVLDIMGDSFEKKVSTLNILLSYGGIEKFYESLVDKESKISGFMALINNEVKSLLALGIKEGIITTDENLHYQMMAVLGAVSSFSHYFNHRALYNDVTLEEAKDITYRMLIKVLN